jgi:hypothetical protein
MLSLKQFLLFEIKRKNDLYINVVYLDVSTINLTFATNKRNRECETGKRDMENGSMYTSVLLQVPNGTEGEKLLRSANEKHALRTSQTDTSWK